MQSKLLINGRLVAGEGASLAVLNPALGSPLLHINEASAEQVDAAVRAADAAFDGWSQTALQAAIAESGVAPGLAHAIVPRGAVDLALAYHHQGDRRMVQALRQSDLSAMRFRDRIAHAVRLRLADADREDGDDADGAVRLGDAGHGVPEAVHQVEHRVDPDRPAEGAGIIESELNIPRGTRAA